MFQVSRGKSRGDGFERIVKQSQSRIIFIQRRIPNFIVTRICWRTQESQIYDLRKRLTNHARWTFADNLFLPLRAHIKWKFMVDEKIVLLFGWRCRLTDFCTRFKQGKISHRACLSATFMNVNLSLRLSASRHQPVKSVREIFIFMNKFMSNSHENLWMKTAPHQNNI